MLNPLTLRLIAACLLATGLFGAGWQINGWRLHGEMRAREIELSRSALRYEQNASAEYAARIAQAHAAEARLADARNTWAQQSRARDREYQRHADTHPLPADCRLDDGRMRILTDDIAAANAAIAGPAAERAGLPADPAASGQPP